ncbi:hypothetical protein ACLB2K_045830 [Fragaria x ananassa]
MGGLWKTTFTQLVFKDAQVQARFDIKGWVCVSDPFDVIKIVKEILELVGGIKSQDSSNVLQKLLESIQERIKDYKFLLVVDDVRKEGQAKGESLRGQDKFNKGFGDTAEKIVRKCDGLPLVLKTLGSLLTLLLHKQTIREWEEVLNTEIWKVKVVQEEVFRPLLLSYYDLSPEIKSCLLHCATYPKDFEFNKEILIQHWMSQGYLSVGENKEEVTKSGEVFTKLVMRCFFQDFRQNALTKDITGCKMHDSVHDFVQYLTQNECFTMEAMSTDGNYGIELSSAEILKRPGNKVRHLTLMTLNLKQNQIERLPEEIGELIHLRDLGIRNLRTLEGCPSVYCSEDSEVFTLGDLRMMNQLHRLAIYVVRIGDDAASKAEKAELRTKERLSHLELYMSGNKDVDAILIDALQPPENLESLKLLGIKLQRGPVG